MDTERLGRPVSEQMTTPVRTIDPDVVVADAARLLWDEQIGSLLVDDDERAILTESDVVRGVAEGRDPETTPVHALATPDPVTVPVDATVGDATGLMTDHGVKKLPVVQGGEMVGIITTTDIARVLVPSFDDVVAAFQ
jgi:CBS domain-containing protein